MNYDIHELVLALVAVQAGWHNDADHRQYLDALALINRTARERWLETELDTIRKAKVTDGDGR